MTLLAAVLATMAFMVLQDIVGTSLVISESRCLKFWPGLFDGLGDFANRYGAAISAVTAVHFGLASWQTFVVVTATACTSFFTTNLATQKVSKLLPPARLETIIPGRVP